MLWCVMRCSQLRAQINPVFSGGKRGQVTSKVEFDPLRFGPVPKLPSDAIDELSSPLFESGNASMAYSTSRRDDRARVIARMHAFVPVLAEVRCEFRISDRTRSSLVTEHTESPNTGTR
jgi:hypothetical protein